MTSTAAPVLAPPVAGPPRRGARLAELARRHPEVLTAVLCALVLAAGIRGPDLPAQNYRVWLLRTHGLIIFDSHWYAGHTLPGYSLLFPPLAAVVGPRLLGALACVAATALFSRLLRGRRHTGHDLAVLWFAAVIVVNLVIGRLPFALGVTFGIAALVAVRERHPWWALLLGVLCSAASPLAGAFLMLAGASWLPAIGWRRALPLAGPLLGIGAAALFGEGGYFPFSFGSLLAMLGFCASAYLFSPRSERVARFGVVLYAAAAVALYLVPNPIGGNMIRYGAVFSGPLAAYVCMRHGRRLLLAAVAVPLLLWQFWQVPAAVASRDDDIAAHAGYYAGLVTYLDAHGGSAGRVEVPLTKGRWETDYLAAHVPLARGWERQVDLGLNRVLYNPRLTADAYHRWLLDNGVRWVALPDAPLDSSEMGEQALLTGPELPFLRPAWHDQHWQLWEVRDATPLTRGPVVLRSLGVSRVELTATGAGTATVLVRWTRFWQVATGTACVAPTPNGWTSVRVFGPGPVTITARADLGSLVGGGGTGSCSDDVPAGTRP